ncbi:hypothetical protein P691DRAFT_144768 [Macrolepiota fuliginosa MF-IS2]|uniref:Uncharacterized protein n=1 Tax=Macrolepiota fuliginosa MF-IS2 TaxID=1400762 RepID=A0A9P5XD19_9AGAR|nr:hypothetical protein P691DRAFT_144768 [Macrolepiota fuliginosa MF-IS2]
MHAPSAWRCRQRMYIRTGQYFVSFLYLNNLNNIPMGAQQSRAGSAPAPGGQASKFSRHLKRHSGVDKLASVFRPFTSGPSNSRVPSAQEAQGQNARPEQGEEKSEAKAGTGSATPASVTAALGGGTAVSAAAPVGVKLYICLK